jgi:GTPase SAR1 family protein
MRLAISGTAHSGKTTLLKSFLHTWNDYESPIISYRDILKEKQLDHSKETTPETQSVILDHLVDTVQGYKIDDTVIFDRCPLDALVYTLWAHDKGLEGFDKDFVTNQIAMCRESMRSLDIIFLSRFDESQQVKAKKDGTRETDVNFIKEVDNIFYTVYMQYMSNPTSDVFFPNGDSPTMILLPSHGQARVDIIAEYVTPEGTMYGEEESILNPDNLSELEQLVELQQAQLDKEDNEKELFKKFGVDQSQFKF